MIADLHSRLEGIRRDFAELTIPEDGFAILRRARHLIALSDQPDLTDECRQLYSQIETHLAEQGAIEEVL